MTTRQPGVPMDDDGGRPFVRQVALDCAHPRLLAEFYRGLLGYHYRPGDDADVDVAIAPAIYDMYGPRLRTGDRRLLRLRSRGRPLRLVGPTAVSGEVVRTIVGPSLTPRGIRSSKVRRERWPPRRGSTTPRRLARAVAAPKVGA